ncbi:MAG TPA: polymer-forming cytoskeletal protein [Rhodanobacteraceae bacterium]
MFNNNTRKPTTSTGGADTSLIARSTAINGDVRFSGALHLDGCIEGSVIAEAGSRAVFTLSAEGQVTGEIRVPNAVINGTVKGNIHVSERLELAAQARIDGDVHYRVLEMAAGAEVNGRMLHEGEQAPRQLAGPESTLEADADVDDATAPVSVFADDD